MSQHVYITDDEIMVRRFLKKALDHEGMITKTFERGADLLAAIDSLEPGVILLDIRMPEMGGLQVLESLAERTRVHGVLMLSSHGDVSTAVRAIHAGAVDFIEKPFSVQVLIQRIRQLHQQIDEWRTSRMAVENAKSRLNALSKREIEVGLHLAKGLTNKEIARELQISPRTVEAHRARLMQKLEISSLADVVRLFLSMQA